MSRSCYDCSSSLTLYILVICVQFLCDGSSVDKDSRFTAGREKYEAIKKEAKMPKYGPCWTEALGKIEDGCKELTDDVQHYLSLMFTNCFLLKTGRKNYPCDGTQDITECTRDMTSEAYNVYTEFFTHTQNICFFLQSQVWQAKTENTVNRLRDSSETVAKQIEDSSQIQAELIKQQNQSIENQQRLIEHGFQLKETIHESKVDVDKMMLEFKSSTSEQKQLIFEVFDKVNVLQKLVMGEFTGFYSLIFYAVSILVSYLLTSTPRTSGARFWLFVLMTTNMVIERMLVMWGVHHNIDSNGNLIDENTAIYNRLALTRRVFTAFAVFIWGWFAYSYQDINQVNNKLLMEIQQQNSELKHLLQGQGKAQMESHVLAIQSRTVSSNAPQDSSHGINQVDGPLPRKSPPASITNGVCGAVSSTQESHVTSVLDSSAALLPDTSMDRRGGGDYSGDSDFESDTSSLSSNATDHTFTADVFNDSRSSCASSFMTTSSIRDSRESTPALWEDDEEERRAAFREELQEELQHLRDCTPLREMTPIPGVTLAIEGMEGSALGRSVSSPRRGRGRPRGSHSKSLASSVISTPVRYNLRSRKGIVPISENPIVETETAENFAKTVKHLAQVAVRNRAKAVASVSRLKGRRSAPVGMNSLNMFSSDDDM